MCCDLDMPREVICIELDAGRPCAELSVLATHSYTMVLGRGGATPPHLQHDDEGRVQWEAPAIRSNVCQSVLGMPALEQGSVSAVPVSLVLGRPTPERPAIIGNFHCIEEVQFAHLDGFYIFDGPNMRPGLVEWFGDDREALMEPRDIEMVLRVSWVTPRQYPPGAAAVLPAGGEFMFWHLDVRDWTDAQARIGPDPNREEPLLPLFGRRNTA